MAAYLVQPSVATLNATLQLLTVPVEPIVHLGHCLRPPLVGGPQ